MANTTVTRPTDPDKVYFLSVGWYVLFFPASDPTTNILEGWKVSGFSKDANTADTLEGTHQQSALPWKEWITTLIDAGTLNVTAMYDATLEMPMTGGIEQSRTTGTFGKAMLAFRDSAAADGMAIVAFECDANLQSWGGIDGATLGQIINSPFAFKLSGQPTYHKVDRVAMSMAPGVKTNMVEVAATQAALKTKAVEQGGVA